jgi:hypothetical protein
MFRVTANLLAACRIVGAILLIVSLGMVLTPRAYAEDETPANDEDGAGCYNICKQSHLCFKALGCFCPNPLDSKTCKPKIDTDDECICR